MACNKNNMLTPLHKDVGIGRVTFCYCCMPSSPFGTFIPLATCMFLHFCKCMAVSPTLFYPNKL